MVAAGIQSAPKSASNYEQDNGGYEEADGPPFGNAPVAGCGGRDLLHHGWRVWIHFIGDCCMEEEWDNVNELFVVKSQKGRLRGERDAILKGRLHY